MLDKLPETSNTNQMLPPPIPPRGRWAQRIDGQGLVVRSYLDSDSVIPFPNTADDPENSHLKQINEDTVHNEFNNRPINETKDNFEVSEQSLKEILNGTYNEEVNGSVIMRQTSNNMQNSNNRKAKIQPVSRSNTIRLEELDAEDERSDSEISEMVYYPVSEDGSDIVDMSFHVCANNESNNKDATGRLKRPRPERVLSDVPALNTTEQIETNSDEEDASTPVDSDRSFLSSLCISTENLERLGQREKFMKSNYESLEKQDSVETRHNDLVDKNFYRQSISAKFLAGSLLPLKRTLTNGSLTPAGLPERQLSTPTKKREELLKALSDAKKTLKTVGYRTGLSSSKSIADLHSTPDREIFKSPRYRTPSDIRKAASMTDLSINLSNRSSLFSPPPPVKSNNEPKTAAPLWSQSKMYPIDTSPPESPRLNTSTNPQHNSQTTPTSHPEPVCRSNSSSSLYVKNNHNTSGNLYKTSSVYALDRTSPYRSGGVRAQLSIARNTPSPAGRPSLPSLPPKYQTPNMVATAQLATDSSSDSSPSEITPVKSGRPVASSRPLGMRHRYSSLSESVEQCNGTAAISKEGSQKLRLKSRSEWDLKNSSMDDGLKGKDSWQSSRYLSYSPRKNYIRPLKLNPGGRPAMHSTPTSFIGADERRDSDFPDQSSFLTWDPSSVPLTPELCDNIADNLTRVSSFAMQVLQRVTLSTDLPPDEKSSMANTISQGMWQAQQNLRPAVHVPSPWMGSAENLYDPRRLPGLNFPVSNGNDPSLQRLHPTGSQPEGIDVMAVLEQYSNQLVSMVEKKISGSQDKPNN